MLIKFNSRIELPYFRESSAHTTIPRMRDIVVNHLSFKKTYRVLRAHDYYAQISKIIIAELKLCILTLAMKTLNFLF